MLRRNEDLLSIRLYHYGAKVIFFESHERLDINASRLEY